MELQREQEQRRRRPQIVASRNGSIVASPIQCVGDDDSQHGETLGRSSPIQHIGDDDSKHGETLGCSIPCLPEDIWHHIHSLMPMHDAARSACISHAFLSFWRCHPNLTLDPIMLCWDPYGGNFSSKVDSILRNHSGIGLKILKLSLDDDPATFPYVDSWLQVAVTPGIEELTLKLYEKYNFPCSLLSDGVRKSIRYLKLRSCGFRPTVELGPLRSLTSVSLDSVCIARDELECLLSNSLALESLHLYGCKEIISLKIPCMLQQLNSLSVMTCRGLEVIESKAPNLSQIYLHEAKIKFSPREALQMKDFTLSCANGVCYARAELPSIMPNLERLVLHSCNEVVNTPTLPTKFLYLKHLTITMISGGAFSPSYDYFSLISFFDASPSLETLLLNVYQGRMEHESVFGGGSSHLRQLPEQRPHDCLKSVEIIGFSAAKGLVELTCCIVKNAVSLERLVRNTLRECGWCSQGDFKTCRSFSKTVLDEAFRTVTAIRRYIEDEVPPGAKLTVVEPCARCHSSSGLMMQGT